MKNHSCNLHAPLCVIFCLHSVDVARYAALIQTKSSTNCDVHLTESISFTIKVSEADETITKKEPWEAVMELAARKARAVAESGLEEEDVIVIGADTVVAVDGKILGKPHSKEEAEEMLRLLSGRVHQVCTGVALLSRNQGSWRERTFYEETQVEMYPITEEEIREYVATGEPMDKAGAYGIQGRAAIFVKGIQGDYNNVVGLPVGRLYQELKR